MPRRASITGKEQVTSHPAIAGGHVILLSPENPTFPEAATFQGAPAMQQAFESAGLHYEPTRGKYGKPESSFIVHIEDPAHIEATLGIAKRFGQEAVVHSTGGKHQLVWVNGPHEGQATVPSSGHDFYESEPEDNYTMIPGPNGEPHGFVAFHLNLNDPPVPYGTNAVPAADAAKAVLKAAVETYQDILLGLRMRELAKAEEQTAKQELENDMKLTDLLKSQVAKAPQSNGGQIRVGKGELAPTSDNGKLDKGWKGAVAGAALAAAPIAAGAAVPAPPTKVINYKSPPAPAPHQLAAGVPGSRAADLIAEKPALIPASVKKGEVAIPAGNKKASGGQIRTTKSIWKKAEVCSAPEANGGQVQVGKSEVKVSAGNRKASGGSIRLGKQEWVIDLKATGHDEKRVIEKDPVKGAKGFEEPKKQDRPEESSATGGSIKENQPKKGPAQGNKPAEYLKEQSAPGGPQDLGDGGAVKGNGDAKGGGTDIYDSVKGKRSPAKDPVIEKKETMAAPKAPGAGSPSLSATSGGTSAPKMGLPKPAVGAKPAPAMKAEKDISAVPASPSAGPAGNTAITSVQTKTFGKSEAQTVLLTSLRKAVEFTPEQLGGSAKDVVPGLAAPQKFAQGGKTLAAPGMKLSGQMAPPAPVRGAVPSLAPRSMPASLSGPIDPPRMAKPLGVAAPVVSPVAGRKARVAAQDAAMMGGKTAPVAGKLTVKKEVASAPAANGGKVTVAKEEPRASARAAAGKPSIEHTLFEESDPKVLHPSDKKKSEPCKKGCGKIHKGETCGAQ